MERAGELTCSEQLQTPDSEQLQTPDPPRKTETESGTPLSQTWKWKVSGEVDLGCHRKAEWKFPISETLSIHVSRSKAHIIFFKR